MNREMIEALDKALDELLAISPDQLLERANDPANEFFFSDLAKTEKIWSFEETDRDGQTTQQPRCGRGLNLRLPHTTITT